MPTQLRAWLNAVPLRDPVERRSASLLQVFLIGLIVIPFVQLLFIVSAPNLAERLPTLITILVLEVCMGSALALLRGGHFKMSVTLVTGLILLALGVNMVLTGLRENRLLLLAFALPIVLAGLLAGRRGAMITLVISIAITAGVGFLEEYAPDMVGFSPPPYSITGTILLFGVIIGLLWLFIDQFGTALREALTAALARERELEQLRASLEVQVVERTAALQTALADIQAQSTAQARMLTELEQQRAIIRNLSVPVIPISARTLVIPLVGELDSERLRQLQEQALQALQRSAARTLVLDITGVGFVDNQVAQGLLLVVQATRLLGAETVIVGVRPEVAQALVGLGQSLEGTRTFSDLQSALQYRIG